MKLSKILRIDLSNKEISQEDVSAFPTFYNTYVWIPHKHLPP